MSKVMQCCMKPSLNQFNMKVMSDETEKMVKKEKDPLLEKSPNTEFFLVHIFLYSDWIQENTDQFHQTHFLSSNNIFSSYQYYTMKVFKPIQHSIVSMLDKMLDKLASTIVIRKAKIVWKHGPYCLYFGLNVKCLGWPYGNTSKQRKWLLAVRIFLVEMTLMLLQSFSVLMKMLLRQLKRSLRMKTIMTNAPCAS